MLVRIPFLFNQSATTILFFFESMDERDIYVKATDVLRALFPFETVDYPLLRQYFGNVRNIKKLKDLDARRFPNSNAWMLTLPQLGVFLNNDYRFANDREFRRWIQFVLEEAKFEWGRLTELAYGEFSLTVPRLHYDAAEGWTLSKLVDRYGPKCEVTSTTSE